MFQAPIPKRQIAYRKRRDFVWLSFAAFFILGWVVSSMYASLNLEVHKLSVNKFFSNDPVLNTHEERTASFFSNDRASPADRLTDSNVQLSETGLALTLGEAPRLSRFTDSNSMDPVIDHGANAVEVTPKSSSDIRVGDIISYRTGDGVVIHRVIGIGKDEQGIYYTTKGDNNPIRDFIKVRFNQIQGVVVAIVY